MIVKENDKNLRVDVFINKNASDLSRTRVKNLILDKRLKLNNNTPEKFLKLMRSVNPLIIPRNHKVEKALEAADNNDLTLLKKLIKVLETPYKKQQENIDYQSPAPIGDKKYQTFCGT